MEKSTLKRFVNPAINSRSKTFITSKCLPVLFLILILSISFAHATVYVTGNQSGTWTKANSPYILSGSVIVPAGSMLTIEAGVTVIFPRFDYKITVNGIVKAEGIATDSIRFIGQSNKSYNPNSTHGGSIVFNKDSSILKYVSIDSLGDSYYNKGAIVVADKILPTIANSKIRNSETTDIYTWIGGAKNISNYTGVIGIMPNSTVTINATMPKAGAGSYYNLLGPVIINAGVKLTMKPGITLYFPRFDYKLTLNGILDAQGTSSDSIRIKGTNAKSYNANSTHGGSIIINQNGSILKYMSIDSLGDNYNNYNRGAIIIADKITPTISNTSIRNSESTDVYTWIGGAKTISNLKGVVGIMPGTVTTDAIMPKPNSNNSSSYYKLLGTVTVDSGFTLTILPGVKIVCPSGTADLMIKGVLIARGNLNDSIKFIGTYLGNTVKYGGSIYLSDNSTLSFAVLDSLGAYDNGALIISGKSFIQDCIIKNSHRAGIYVSSPGVSITYCNILKNVIGISTINPVSAFRNLLSMVKSSGFFL